MVRVKTWIWRWGPAVAYMAVIFIVSAIPDLTRLPADVSDKTAHAGAYAVLGAFVARAFAGARWSGCTPRAAWQAWVFATAYGVTDEWHQTFVPGRTASGLDVIADAAGSAMGVVAVLGLARTRWARGREV